MKLRTLVPPPLVPAARRVSRMLGLSPSAAKRPATPASPARPAAEKPGKRREELHAYWQDPDDAENRPDRYAIPVDRSEYLVELLGRYCKPGDRILEIGPNVGRNLEHLRGAGYRRLAGIEISAKAVAAMGVTYPDLAAMAEIHNAPVEDVITHLADASFDTVFTMAVLEHLHPDSEWVFAEMVRIARTFIVTIEDEGGRSPHHFPRDYRAVFEGLGMEQILEGSPPARADGLTQAFRTRVFRHPPTT